MKYRAVSWLVFPALCIVSLIINFILLPAIGLFYNIFTNMSIIAGIFLMVTFYFSIKYKKLVNVTKELIGWGDILFFLFLALFLSPLNFIFFFTLSLFFIALGAGIYILKKGNQIQIPLAGLQALLLIILFLTDLIIGSFSFHSDEWIMTMIY